MSTIHDDCDDRRKGLGVVVWNVASFFGAIVLAAALLHGCSTAQAEPLTFTTEREDVPIAEPSAAPAATPAPAVQEWHGVIVFTTTWCGACPEQKRQVTASKLTVAHEGDNKPAHILMIDSDKHPDIARRYRIEAIPTSVSVHGEREVSRSVGVTNAAKLKAMWHQSTGVKAAVKSAPAKAVHHGGLYYSRHAGRWTWPGDLRQHLQHPPHSLSAAAVSRMSDSECIGYHDSWHNKHGGR